MHHARVLRPAEGIYAFYDGRVDGYRSPTAELGRRGALSLGIASYAIVDGERGARLRHPRLGRPRALRSATTLEARGGARITVVLSHWHLDHVAGTEAFADCEVIATARTAELLAAHREGDRGAAQHEARRRSTRWCCRRGRSPAVTARGRRGRGGADPRDIHSDDATVLWLPEQRLLLAGDTMEDTVTYVDRARRARRSPAPSSTGCASWSRGGSCPTTAIPR